MDNPGSAGAKKKGARRKRPPSSHFDAIEHRAGLLGAIGAIAQLCAGRGVGSCGPLEPKQIERILRKHPRGGNGLFSRSQLISGFRQLSQEQDLGMSEEEFLSRVRLRPTRTASGVSPVTVFTKPFACPGQCIFCPNDTRMPKSYLSDEPGAQRAEDNAFDPYLQTWNRLSVFHALGHATSKVELIILGGTWSHYPHAYQRWFVMRCFDAMNDFSSGLDMRHLVWTTQRTYRSVLSKFEASDPGRASYNGRVTAVLRSINHGRTVPIAEESTWPELFSSQRANEECECRCVGLAVETRPDEVNERCVVMLRQLGCTKVQLGYQSLNDDVLVRNKRGHSVEKARAATRLLRASGFKIHAHWMPNLLGSSPLKDQADFDRMFSDLALRPDELKIYPCSLIETAELMDYYGKGQWRPYTTDELITVIGHALRQTPRYCRLSRIVRDIPSGDIVTGNRRSNLREVVSTTMRDRAERSIDIREREARLDRLQIGDLIIQITEYDAEPGTEYFLEWVTHTDRLAAFLRLFLPHGTSFIPEISKSALIRELHVYGVAQRFGQRNTAAPQHHGLGQGLLTKAAEVAMGRGFTDLAVISAVGTRNYYRQMGFSDGELYQHRSLQVGAPC
ncbi:MAG: tRNA uridine(34) 5-carboxymethylaminomethyl modification radical SAM/GNAT enzyme Elp3 [Myxococcales bacterium]|nr:tRNA uridine(34) 5-carboxymethylaminomethyl modification radical SAM/GNAT enzyme Elp3 [Myxococcales bacterium]MCB9708194.1 tRNA uridine(34) 5-carboxymethylaminomethyl modification radical SAM/GNAT enzyme Elp3 [Myxococcales bacterium]